MRSGGPAHWCSWGSCWHRYRERQPNNIRPRSTLVRGSHRVTHSRPLTPVRGSHRVTHNRPLTLVQHSRRLIPVPDTADQPPPHRHCSRKRSRHRPVPRWYGRRATGTGAIAVGCGCRVAMSPVLTLMPPGFPAIGAPGDRAGSGFRDIGAGSCGSGMVTE
jgi:hypothetical protein